MMTIGERIRELRKASGLSQEQLAKQVDVTRQTISNWEANIAQPSLEKIIMISDLFQVSLDQLIKGEKQKHYQEVNIEKLAKMNWEYRKKTLALIIGMTLISLGVVTYLVTYAIKCVGSGLGYTLYRYIVIGEYVSPLVDLTKVTLGAFMLVVLGIIIIGVFYRDNVKDKLKSKN